MPAQYDKPLDMTQYPPKQFYYWQEEGEKWYKDVFPLRKMGRNDFFLLTIPKTCPACVQRLPCTKRTRLRGPCLLCGS